MLVENGAVTEPVLAYDLVVRQDYGQFSLCGGESWDSEYEELVEAAIGGPQIAGDERTLVVLSPHQNNFRMVLRVEVWEQAPPDDSGAWEEVFEGPLTVNGGSLEYASPTMNSAAVNVPDGDYVVRIHGRGFVNRGWPGSTEPGDTWRVQMWPGDGPTAYRHLKMWQMP